MMQSIALVEGRCPSAAAYPRPGSSRPAQSLLRGRDHELELIGETVAGVANGNGGALILDGPTGIGKTRLLREAATMARRNGVRTAWGAAQSTEVHVVLGPLLEALFGGREPLCAAENVRGLSVHPDHRYWLVRELQQLIEQLTVEQPLLIVLDDLQWADTETLAVLGRLLADLAEARVAWLLAARVDESPVALSVVIDDLLRTGGRYLQMSPLPTAAVAAMIGDLLRGDADAGLLELVGRAAGNPFLVVELMEGLREEGMLDEDAGLFSVRSDRLPARLEDSVRRRLEGLGGQAEQLVSVAAILGRFSIDHLVRMLESSPSALLRPLDEAFRANLLIDDGGLLAFRQELFREAVVATLPRTVRRGLQRQAAEVLLAARGDPLTVAAHMAAGADRGDRAAADALRLAARSSVDPGAAADLSAGALSLTFEDDPSWGELAAETIGLLHAAMRSEEADALAAVALEGKLSVEQEADVLLSLSSVSLRSEDERATYNRRALELDGLSPAVRARHMALLAQNVTAAGRFAAAEPLIASASALAQACGDALALTAVLVAEATLEEARGNYRRALELVHDGRRCSAGVSGSIANGALEVARARLLATTGKLSEGLEVATNGIEQARRDGQFWMLRDWNGWRGRLLLESGDLGGARTVGEAVLTMPAGEVNSRSDLHGVVTLARIALHTGEAKCLRRSLVRAREAHEHGSPVWRRQMAWILALAAFQDGRPGEAVRWLHDDELPYAAPYSEPTHPPTVVRIALSAGQCLLAERAAALAEAHAQHNPDNHLLRGIAVHARGLTAGDVDELLLAVRYLRHVDRPLALAAALEDASVALVGVKRLDEAAVLAGEAFDLWQQTGAVTDARRVRRHLRALGVHRAGAPRRRADHGWESLTDSELSVVRLVANGETNRQVAESLILSRHTVSTHLRHAFVKLRINSRVELTRVVLDHELAIVAAS